METDLLNKSIDGQKNFQVFSGSTLKLMALAAMMIDHTALVLLKEFAFANTPLLSVGTSIVTLYSLCRLVGRLAFPIYAFLLTEGCLHTHHKKRYGVRLLLFALISEIPWNLMHNGQIFYERQNVFFTLFLGYLAICCYERYRKQSVRLLLTLLGVFAAALILKADYGLKGVGFILFLYLMREAKALRALIGCCFFSSPVPILFAFLPIGMYNGKRGFIKGKAVQYLFYAAYPLHIMILYLIKERCFGY